MDMMKCTAPQKATELCCRDWGSIEWSESLGFAPDSPRVDDGPPTALQLNKDAEVIHVCTFGESPRALMGEAGLLGGGMMPVGCFETHFTEDKLTGGDEELSLKPGELVLRERILWFMRQGIAVEDVPTCNKIVQSCPNGKPPLTVADDFLAEAAKKSFLQNGVDTTLLEGEDQEEHALGWGGALMTSGSFTMMAPAGGA